MESSFLRSVLAQESRAYGFTIAFWGSGALLISEFGVPSFGNIMLYASGAIAGFALLTLFAFRKPLKTVEYEETDFMVFSMIHFLSGLLPILFTSWATSLAEPTAFLASGASVSTNYNILMVIEERLVEKVAVLEEYLSS